MRSCGSALNPDGLGRTSAGWRWTVGGRGGPGDLPAATAAVGPDGKVIGVDQDPLMRDTARQRTRGYPCGRRRLLHATGRIPTEPSDRPAQSVTGGGSDC